MTRWLGFSPYCPMLGIFPVRVVVFFRKERVTQFRRWLGRLVGFTLLVTVGFSASAQDANWIRLSTLNAAALAKTPALTQRALRGTLAAFQEKWKTAKPLIGTGGEPLPRRNAPIEPTIAWAELQANGNEIGLSLSDSNCDGPNSAAAPDLYVCEATLSTADQKGDNYHEKIVSVCYTGQDEKSANEIAYNKTKNVIDYRVIIPDVNTESCNRSFLLN